MGLGEWRTGFAVLLACFPSERLCLANTFPHYITQALIPFQEHNAYPAYFCQLSDILYYTFLVCGRACQTTA